MHMWSQTTEHSLNSKIGFGNVMPYVLILLEVSEHFIGGGMGQQRGLWKQVTNGSSARLSGLPV